MSSDSPYGYDFGSIVPHPDVALLRCRTAASGYRNVYLHRYRDQPRNSEQRFVAKVKSCGRLMRLRGSAHPLPHVCALHVLVWYRDRYGELWREAIRGLHVRQKAHVRAWWSQAAGGWRCRVWERGRPVEVVGWRKPGCAAARFDAPGDVVVPRPGSRRRGARLLVFASEGAALAFARLWLAARWGERWEAVVWRPVSRAA